MSSSPSTNDLGVARQVLETLERRAYRELGLPLPNVDTGDDVEMTRRYLSSNPDITPQKLAEALAQLEEEAVLQPNVVDLSGPPTRSILNQRVQEIGVALEGFDPCKRFARTCFGTVPGGGLDASSFKVEGSDEYAVVIPEGFFHLTNLLTKLVILLQPITQTPSGPAFLPSASFDQLGRLGHPYVLFRHRDLLEGFFLWGDSKVAFPYTKALPFQDRFAYLLVGTELFVLAHELAHVVLGHLDLPAGDDAEALELEADALALRIVTAFFLADTNYPIARASLCGLLFISMVMMWEAGLERLTGDGQIARSHTHPSSSARFQHYAQALGDVGDSEMPTWFVHTHNAIRYLTDWMLSEGLDEISRIAASGDGVSARVLPRSHQHLGHFNVADSERWWAKLASMIASKDPAEHRLGLWLLVAFLPSSAVGIYRGVVDENDSLREQCEAALVAIEPIYANYIPRLRERYRETARAEDFEEYLHHLSIYLGAKASVKLGHVKELDPMDERFFDVDKTDEE
jgi:hypothetical protein